MFRHHLQHLEILLKCVRSAYFYNISKSIKYLFVFKNILESWNFNFAMKYFAMFDKNVATIFRLQWNIENIPDIFLQYSVLCGKFIFKFNFWLAILVRPFFISKCWIHRFFIKNIKNR